MNKTKSNKEKSCRQVITPKSGNRTGRATPTLFGRVSGCVHFFGAGLSPSPFNGFEAVFGSFLRLFGGRKDKLDKEVTSQKRFRHAQLPAVRAVPRSSGIRESDITNRAFQKM